MSATLAFASVSAQAGTSYVDGISDQSIPNWDGGFSSSYFAGFFSSNWASGGHIRLARYVVQWNVISAGGESRSNFENWLTDIASMGLTPDVGLTSYNGVYPSSSSEYKTHLQELLAQAKAMGHSIRYLEAWNEPNNQGKESAVNAAHFTNSAYSACEEGYGCTIIAGDVEDSSGAKGYEEEYRKNLSPVPTVWGLHAYYSVEYENESYYTKAVEGLPNGGAGDQVWITEVAARKCTDYNGHLEEHGEAGQAERAKWLVDNLIATRKPEHVFYYEFMPGGHKQPSCSSSETEDDALYVPSSDPNAPDRPRAAASFAWGGKGFPWGYTGAPTVSSTELAATLTASIYPGGFLDTRYRFEYGTSTSYGLNSTEGDAGSGFGGVGVSIPVSGLAEGVTYHYRVVAWNGEGTNDGADATFTAPRRPTVTTEQASSVQFKRATLNGTVNPNGLATNYYFQYGETISYGKTVPAEGGPAGSGTTPVHVPNTITSLNTGTTYHFRLVAANSIGASYGIDHEFTTATPPILAISNRLQSSMTLTWTASANASSYTIMRNGATVGSTTSGLTYVDTNLQPTTFYYYEVVANEENESAGSNVVTRATTPLNTAKADINGDGKTDLVYIYPGGYIDTFVSKGNGTHEETIEHLKEFESTQGLWLTGDFNGDGKTDLVYIYPGGYIDTFLSKGNGTYEEKSELVESGFNSTGGTWEVGDFNGDGKTDLAYILPGGYIDTFLSKGNGTYEETIEHVKEFDSTTGRWFTGDFNGDGKTDLAYIYPGGYIDTFLSKGNGTYEEKQELIEKEFNSTSGQWFTGDFNGDGKTDLAYIYPGGYIDTFLSKGNGTYEEKSELIEKEFNTISGQWLVGDFNDDGKADLVYVYPGGYIDTFLSKGNGTYEEAIEHLKEFDSTSGRWRTGDVNGDGKTDLMYTYPGGYLDTFLSKGNGTYEGISELVKEFDDTTGLWL
jgi:hypothetical protein